MSASILTEEPQDMEEQHDNMNEGAPGRAISLDAHHKDPLRSNSWTEEDWTKGILEMGALSIPKSKLQHRIDAFLQCADDIERNAFEGSRAEMRQMIDLAQKEYKKRQCDQPQGRVAMRTNIKKAWSSASQLAFSYVQMLDVMVGQAPEYVALAYGAVKIILVVQVNHEEVKQKVPAFMEAASKKFDILDHLTAYRPNRNLLAAVSQAYHLYIKFLAKAVKLYTQCRIKTYLKAFSNPWKTRFQGLVDSIEATFREINDIAQYHGLLETHMSLTINREALGLLREQNAKADWVLSVLDNLSNMVAVHFTKSDDIRETAANIRQHVEENIDQPMSTNTSQSTGKSLEPESASSQKSSVDQVLDDIFPELRAQHDESKNRARAMEELQYNHAQRSKQKSLFKSEQLVAWLHSDVSELLWIDGSNLLTVADCNALFTNPLLLAGEGEFESTLVLWFSCHEMRLDSSKRYTAIVQALVSQILKQNPEIFQQLRQRLTREQTADVQSLWKMLLSCIDAVDASCIFIIINCADELGNGEESAAEEREAFLRQMKQLLHDQQKLVKVLLTAGLRRATNSEAPMSSATLNSQLTRRHPTRSVSIDGLQADAPLLSHDIVRIQEKRCEALRFTELPFVYTIGTTVFEYEQGQLQAFVIAEASGMEPTGMGDLRPLVLLVWSVDHDGSYFTKSHREIRISHFKGRRRIRDLRYIPSGFLPDEAKHRKELFLRGKRYWSLGEGVHLIQVRTNAGLQRAMVDQRSRPLDVPSAHQTADQFQQTDVANLKPGALILCPSTLTVYVLTDLRWVTVHISDIECIRQTPEQANIFWKKLQLSRDYKEMILKSIRAHETGSALKGKGAKKNIDDFTTERGNGLVLLLYGLPGVGKTLTAESLAILLGKPFLSLTESDLSLNGQIVEEKLQRFFSLAKRWDAILLLDDADGFLQARAKNDPQRGGFVSNLFRMLENYNGILILTTTRMKTFDIAVQSRIHLAIEYGDLSERQRYSIFRSFIDQLNKKNLVENLAEIDKWIQEDGIRYSFNGRQIRNIVLTAMRLAQDQDAEMPKLRRVHLSTAARATEKFQQNLKDEEMIYRAHQIK